MISLSIYHAMIYFNVASHIASHGVSIRRRLTRMAHCGVTNARITRPVNKNPRKGGAMCRNGNGLADSSLYEGLAGFRFALRKFLAFSEVVTRAAGVTPGNIRRC